MTTTRLLLATGLLLCLFSLCPTTDAQNTTATPSVVNVTRAPNATLNGTTNGTTAKPTNATKAPAAKIPKMTWQAWVTIATCFVVLFVLMTRLITCLAAMILSSLFFYLSGIITLKDMLAGLSNTGVVTIALLFICVDPLADLPLVKKLIAVCLGGQSGNPYLARFKIVTLCLLTSSFLNNAPQVAVLTNLIKNHCREHGMYPSQFLMPMDFATLIGNYAIIGTSTNLIVSGMMEQAKLGSMKFFELIKVNGPFFPICLIYLVFAPRILLPLKKGGMFRVAQNVGITFVTRLRVETGSRLIGTLVSQFEVQLPEEKADVTIVEIQRDGNPIADFAQDVELKFELGDIIVLTGSPALLRSSSHILGLAWIPADIVENKVSSTSFARESTHNPIAEDLKASMAIVDPQRIAYLGDHAKESHNSKTELTDSMTDQALQPVKTKTPTPRNPTPKNPTPANTSFPAASKTPADQPVIVIAPAEPIADGTEQDSEAIVRKEQSKVISRSFGSLGDALGRGALEVDTHTTLFEVVVAPRCRSLGASIASGDFQHTYNASVLAARRADTTEDLSGTELLSYTIASGDVLLILANSDFRTLHHSSGEFILINSCEDEEEAEEETKQHYVQVPDWFPFGNPLPHPAKTKGKFIPVPRWYPYLIVLIFLTMIGFAIGGYELVVCALIACIVIVTIGLQSLNRAIDSIELPLMIMVAFSFGLGAAMERSGFATFLGYQIKEANVTGLGLLYIVAGVSAVMGNLITDKAAVQVVVPLVIAMYKQQGLSPLGGIMCCLCVSTQALCTPYGFSTNLMIMGPGGYAPSDFVKFGFILNLLGVIFIPLICYGVYYS